MTSPTRRATREAQAVRNRANDPRTLDDVSAQLDEMVAEAVESRMISMLKSGELSNDARPGIHDRNDPSVRGNRLQAFVTGNDVSSYDSNAVGANYGPSDLGGNAHIGHFVKLLSNYENGTLENKYAKHINRALEITNAFSSVVPASGGFIVPEQMRSDILSLALEQTIVRKRATVFPMSSLTLKVPTIDESTRATTVYGGMTFGFAEESASLSTSEPRFGAVELKAGKLYWYSHIPNELLDDAPALTMWLERRLPAAYAYHEDYYFLQGSGVGEPLGAIKAPGRILVDRGTNNEINYEDVVNMYARMLPGSLNRAVWVASNEAIPQLFNMVKEVGTAGGGPIYVMNAAGDAPVSLFGRPIFYTEHASQLGVAGDLSFIDFNEYLVGDRKAWQLKVSEHYRFQNDQTAMRGIARIDGRPWVPSAITPKNGGDTLSPYVILDA